MRLMIRNQICISSIVSDHRHGMAVNADFTGYFYLNVVSFKVPNLNAIKSLMIVVCRVWIFEKANIFG